jgi:hypothetical protein
METLEALNDLLEVEVRLVGALAERGKVVGVLGQRQPHRLTDEVRDGAVGCRGLGPEGAVDARIEVDGGAAKTLHEESIAL